MKVRLERVELKRPTYRYLGFAIVIDVRDNEYQLPMTGTVAQWLEEGKEYELWLSRESEIGFDDYRLKGEVTIWPLFAKEYTVERTSPLSGAVLYSHRILAREARYERDYEAIVELEQYHSPRIRRSSPYGIVRRATITGKPMLGPAVRIAGRRCVFTISRTLPAPRVSWSSSFSNGTPMSPNT
jgi:hypothetical protein